MSKKTTSTNQPALQLGTRVRCTDDGVTGRITWANGVAVKIKWDDGEMVTWRRDSLENRPLEFLDADDAAKQTEVPAPVETIELPATTETLEAAATATVEPLQADVVPDKTEPIENEPVGETSAPETTEPLPLIPEAPAEPVAATIPTEAAPTPAKAQRSRKTPTEPREKKTSALDAAAKVLAEAGQAMTCKEMIGTMAIKGYWTSPGGKTPDATLCSAILREINVKGEASRFVKTAPGRFAFKATA